MDLRFHVDGLDEITRVVEALRQEDQDIPDEVQDAILRRSEELAELARAAVLAEPTHGTKHTGLREAIAANVEVSPADGGALIEGKPLGGTRHNLPADMDEGGWAHPVFGHHNTEVYQGGYYSWFTDTMDKGEEDLESDIERVLDEAIARIASA